MVPDPDSNPGRADAAGAVPGVGESSADAGGEFAYEVPAASAVDRADRVLSAAFPQFSRAFLQKLFEEGLVWREGEALLKKQKLQPGDCVTFTVPPARPLALRPVDIPLSIIHEDEHIVVVDKAPGMVTHPGAGTGEDTLVHALLHHCRGQLSGIGGVERPGIVHRLDKETSGLIVAAKTDAAFQGLAEAFAGRALTKEYQALVSRVPKAAGGSIDQPIGRHPTHRTRMAVVRDGRRALSDYTVEASWGDLASRLRVRIHTGRTHQIRVHCSWLGHPLLGDTLYGWTPAKTPGIAVPRVMLHAHRLQLNHPVTRKPLRLEAPLPGDFRSVEQALAALAR